MPAVTQKRKSSPHHQKRTGRHHSHGKHYLKTYWPYIPITLIVLIGLVAGNYQPKTHNGVLAYATQMSISTLLSSTNSERAQNGRSALQLSGELTSAAQAKANDMTARNYWSHNTPDGKEPWVFMASAGYDYLKAGENLAYGFDSSAETITGWMNSPGHKANMLDSEFTQVGFGFANSADYNGSGPETVVVAMYGKPQVQSAQTAVAADQATAPPSTPAPSASKPAAQSPAPTTSSTPAPSEQAAPIAQKPAAESEQAKDTPVTTLAPIIKEPEQKNISRIQTIIGAELPWITLAIGVMSGLIVAVVALRHGFAFHKLLVRGEAFVIHHPWADIALVAVVMVGYVLSRTSGVIK